MDFLFTEEQEGFRQEVRSFLDKELPPDWVDYIGTAFDDTIAPIKDVTIALVKPAVTDFRDIRVWISMNQPKTILIGGLLSGPCLQAPTPCIQEPL